MLYRGSEPGQTKIASREHIKLWIASKPTHLKFFWPDRKCCAAGQYAHEVIGQAHYAGYGTLIELSQLSGKIIDRRGMNADQWITFGELHREICKVWG